MNFPLITTRIICAGMTIGFISAQDNPIVGPRALGMGGTGVSTCDDHNAQYYNPAILGFFAQRDANGAKLSVDNNDLGRKQWGTGIDVSAGYTVLGRLSEIIDELNGADIRGLVQNGLSQANDLKRLTTVAHAINELDQSGNAIMGDANGGVGMRIGHWGLGARVTGQTTGYVTNTDLINVAFGASGAVLANTIASSGAPSDGQALLLGTEQKQSLYTRFGGDATLPIDTSSNAWLTVERIDYAMRQAGIQGAAVQQVVGTFLNVAGGTGQSLSNNATFVSLAGFGLAEVPVSYGYSINEHWAVGTTAKGLVGRVYRNEVSIFSNNATESLHQTVDNYTQSFDVGVDVSVAARTDYLQAGFIVRNINQPTFEAPTVNGHSYDSVVLRPQATISESIVPCDWFTLAMDLDLNSIETTTPGYRVQRLGAGAEINPWHVLALRAGAYRNIADGDAESVLTLGAGINLWAVRIDAALAASMRRVQVLDWNLPEEARASLGIMADF